MSDTRIEDLVYRKLCISCSKSKECHETCETCDLYDDEVDNELREETNDM